MVMKNIKYYYIEYVMLCWCKKNVDFKFKIFLNGIKLILVWMIL